MFFGLSQDVYLCAVYIPHIASPHYDNDFISLEGEVSIFSSKGKIVLIGDFNSRTGQNPDFIEKDSSQINDFDGVDLLPPDYVTDTELKRVNQDFIINSHGKNLLDLSLSSRLRTLNGRFLGDSLGYFTYMSNNGFSSVDYAILSESLLPSVKYFKTNDFTYLSDHVQVELYLKCSINDKTKTNLDEKDEKYKNI
jgi:endonuclease/exonuclease/phosphatase family metal-dependent hydrolase